MPPVIVRLVSVLSSPSIPAILNEDNSAARQLAISLGSVFFGAMTYIGNGPYIRGLSIAKNRGSKCPSFFGYTAFYPFPSLGPLFVLIWTQFFWG